MMKTSTRSPESDAGKVVVCAPATLSLAEDLFHRWNEALKSGNGQRVSQCYAEDAVLLPTFSNVPRLSRSEIQDYYVNRNGDWLIALTTTRR